MDKIQEHWNSIFKSTQHEQLGWFENDFKQTFKFLETIGDYSSASIFIAGAGTTGLVDQLVDKCAHLVLNDISDASLAIVQERLAKTTQSIEWINSDISQPLSIDDTSIDIWIDRAVLHFLTDEKKIQSYFNNLAQKVKPGGYVIIAEFAVDGAPKCAALPVHRYSLEEIQERLGVGYTLITSEVYTFVNPNGDDRPYIYTLFQKVDS